MSEYCYISALHIQHLAFTGLFYICAFIKPYFLCTSSILLQIVSVYSRFCYCQFQSSSVLLFFPWNSLFFLFFGKDVRPESHDLPGYVQHIQAELFNLTRYNFCFRLIHIFCSFLFVLSNSSSFHCQMPIIFHLITWSIQISHKGETSFTKSLC